MHLCIPRQMVFQTENCKENGTDKSVPYGWFDVKTERMNPFLTAKATARSGRRECIYAFRVTGVTRLPEMGKLCYRVYGDEYEFT